MTTWLTARELAGMPGMPSSERRTRDKLCSLGIPQRPRAGRGGGQEYDCSALPAETRQGLMLDQIHTATVALAATTEIAQPAPVPVAVAALAPLPALAIAGRKPPSLADKAVADARMQLIDQVMTLVPYQGSTKATQLLALQLASGECSPELQQAARTANQRARTAAVSQRTLYRWLSLHQESGWWGLLPAAVEASTEVDQDVAAVLGLYHSRDGQFRNLSAAAKHVTKQLGRDFDTWTQLYSRARRALQKVDNIALIKTRHSGRERAAKLPFVRRDTSVLKPLDAAVIDGHTFKAKVRHPDHGAPFAPELTVVLDAATRRMCGWSVSLSENTIAVGDAIRHAVGNVGVFAIIYSDNGAGEKNKTLDCDVVGILTRLGTEHHFGRPGHPQAHGLIERSWQTGAINCARQFGSYMGSDADSGTYRRAAAELAKEQRAVRRAAETGEVVRLSTKAPSWAQFVDAIDAMVAEYNGTHRHRSLPKHASGPHAGKHMTPDEAWASMLDESQVHHLSPTALRMTFMPAMLRTAQRGEVVLFNQHYQAPELMGMQVDGKRVRVQYDIHDPSYVVIFTPEGEYVCEAKWNANRRDYFPKAVVQIAREKRVAATLKLRESQIATALRELDGIATAPSMSALPQGDAPMVVQQLVPVADGVLVAIGGEAGAAVTAAAEARPAFFDTPSDRYEWLMRHRGAWADNDASWVENYVQSESYADLVDFYASRGLAWSQAELKSAR